MTLTLSLIILAYVANVFLNRWLNKIAFRYWDIDPEPILWFLSLMGTLLFLIGFICWQIQYGKTGRSNWFTGKHWK